ncbi:MAG: cytochrome c1 [Gammaproteobacteria bacterium]|nr:cytochrome c1 [Gammaproteobacteria bacterium]MBU1645253.1 cytochrome c1 [Gammaproteobacteria bacterium]MBU1971590.1 cytochrome c1 [Gammaproteobacteria bacterium]
MKKLFIALLCAPLLAFASGAELHLDKAPSKSNDLPALQHGAKLFVNYCLNCHSASYVRYNRLTELGLTEDQIRGNLMFTADKVGELMTIGMQRADGKAWFGAPPPDLSVIARARSSEFGSGSDWLYTYLRGFYRDEARPTGWNNVVFSNVGMPHVLWELQGEQEMGADHKLKLVKPGTLKPEEYDAAVADLVGFINWMAEPMAEFRKNLGVIVLIFLSILFVFAYALKREYWKDIH